MKDKTNKSMLQQQRKNLNEAGPAIIAPAAAVIGQATRTVGPKLADTLRGLFAPKQSYPVSVVRTPPKPPAKPKPEAKPPVVSPKKDVTDVPYRDIPDSGSTTGTAGRAATIAGGAAGAAGGSAIKSGAEKAGTTSGAAAAQSGAKSAEFAKWLKRASRLGTAGLVGLTAKELYDLFKQEKEIEKAVDLKQLDIKDILKTDPGFKLDDILKPSTVPLPVPNVADKAKSADSYPLTTTTKTKSNQDSEPVTRPIIEPQTEPSDQGSLKRPPPPITTAVDTEEPVTQTEPKRQRITPPPVPPVAIGTLPPEPPDKPPRRILPPIMPPAPPPPPPPSDDDKKPEPAPEPPKPTPSKPEPLAAMLPPEPPKAEPPKAEPTPEPSKPEPVKPQAAKSDDDDGPFWRSPGGADKDETGLGYLGSETSRLDVSPAGRIQTGFKKDGTPRYPELYNTPESVQTEEPALTEWLKLAGLNQGKNIKIKENIMKPYTPDTNDISRLLNLLKVYESEDKSANWQFDQENDPAWRAEAQRQRNQQFGLTPAERAANERSQAVRKAQFNTDISTVKQPSNQYDPSGQSSKEFNQASSRLAQQGVDLPGLVNNEPNTIELDVGPGFPDAGGEQSKVRALHGSGMNEADMEEGNLFTGNLAKARAAGKKEADLDGDGNMEPVKEDQLAECGDMDSMSGSYGPAEPPEQKSKIVVNANMTSDGEKTLNVTAEGDAAEQLSQLLKLSGLMNGERKMEVDEEYANEPKVKQQSLKHHLHAGDDLHKEKDTYPKVAGGDNPMNPVCESLESRLWKEFQKVKQQ